MASDDDIFDVGAQTEYLRSVANSLPQKSNRFLNKGEENALEAIDSIDDIVNALRNSNAPQQYIDAVASVKADPRVQESAAIFQRSLEGKDSMHRVAKTLPKPEPLAGTKFVAFRDDPLVKGEILTGEADGETDLIRFSNYITGPGTTVGGAVVSAPLNLAEMADAFNKVPLKRYIKAKKKIVEFSDEMKRFERQDADVKKWLGLEKSPDEMRAMRKSYTIDLLPTWVNTRKGQFKRRTFPKTIDKLRARQETMRVEIKALERKHRRRIKAQKVIGLAGAGVRGVTGAFGVANGVVDMRAGDQIMKTAEERFAKKEIDEETYNRSLRDGKLRIAQGFFGIGDGLNNLRQVTEKVLKDKIDDLGQTGTRAVRFLSVVGGTLAIGMGITAITKHSMAAHDALQSGNVGRAAIYGVMAGLDTVSVILDGLSMFFDFVPVVGTAISLALDLLNTLIDGMNLFIGFFADMVDTRSAEQRIKEAFDTHLSSSAFTDYIDHQVEVYKKKGYDLFQFLVDAKGLGIEIDGGDSASVYHTVTRAMSDKAIEDASDENLRRVIIDKTTTPQTHVGGKSDDLILAGMASDTIHGQDGDDLLFGEAGNHTIYGDEGNDYLNGGTSADKLFGGRDDDFIIFEPGLDQANGGPDNDTISISATFFPTDNTKSANALVLDSDGRNRVYVDLRQYQSGRGGIALGALIDDLKLLQNRMHKLAFSPSSQEAMDLVTLYNSGSETSVSDSDLSGLLFWYLTFRGGRYYLTDGTHLYSIAGDEQERARRSSYSINTIPASKAVYNETHAIMEYSGSSKLESILAFAFRRESKIVEVENVSVSSGTDENYKSCQVIGGSETRVINSSSGHNTYIYTGDGNSVVMVTLSHSPFCEIFKYIIGGSGDNTLVFHGGSENTVRSRLSYARRQCILLDHDIELRDANKEDNEANIYAWPHTTVVEHVDRAVFLKNMHTIQFSNKATDQNSFMVDATNLSKGHHFIVDSNLEDFRLVGSSGDDKISVKNLAGYNNLIDGYKGRNMLSLESCELSHDIRVDIDQPYGATSGSLETYDHMSKLRNFTAVRGNVRTKYIGGHAEYDNLLVANGGECTINSRGGSNSLVAMRGRHILQGGSGNDIFEIYGPLIKDFVVITVTNRRDEGVRLQCNGKESNNSTIEIPVLENDHPEVLLLSNEVNIVDVSGQTVTNKGSISVSSDKRSITFNAGSAFSSLGRNSTESVRIQYTTEGSTVVIDERKAANAVKLRGYKNKSQLKLEIAANGDLVFKDSSHKVIFIDQYWGDLYRSEFLDLDSLATNFVDRFPTIHFNGKDPDNSELEDDDLFNFLSDQLSHLKYVANEYSNTMIVNEASSNLVDVSTGDNYIFGKAKHVCYRSGDGADIFDFRELGSGTTGVLPNTLVQTGNGLKLIVLSLTNSQGYIDVIRSGSLLSRKKRAAALLIEDSAPNDGTTRRTSNGVEFAFGSSTVKLRRDPESVVFMKGSTGWMINDYDIKKYVDTKSSQETYQSKLSFNENFMFYGQFNTHSADDAFLQINVSLDGLYITLFANSDTETAEILSQFRVGVITMFDLRAVNIAHMIHIQFQQGIEFEDGKYDANRIRVFVMSCLRDTSRHSIARKRTFLNFSHASESSTNTVYLPEVDALAYADSYGREMYGGTGNNVFKVTESGQTINTGRSKTSQGHDIVHIASNVERNTIQFKARGESNIVGSKYIVWEGYSSDILAVSRPNGDYISFSPGTPFSVTPFTIKNGSDAIFTCEDHVPTYLILGYAGEYEVVKNVTAFVQEVSDHSWVNRFIINQDRMTVFLATDIESSQFYMDLSPFNTVNTFATLHSEHNYSIAIITVHYDRVSNIKVGDLALQIAAYIPGGIRFRDRIVSYDEIVSFLQGVLLKAETTIDQSISYVSGGPSKTLREILEEHDPNETISDILQTCHETFRITDIDAA